MAAALPVESDPDKMSNRARVVRWVARKQTWIPAVIAILANIVLTWNHMVFANDDFLQFREVHRVGLSWKLLTFNVFQHFAPINRLGHWLAFTLAPLNTFVGYVITIPFIVWFAIMITLLLRDVGAGPVTAGALVVVSVLTVPFVDTQSWFDAAMQWFPFLAALTTFLWAHVRYLVRPALLRSFPVFLALLLCIAADVRFVLAVPYALLIDVCVLREGRLRHRLQCLQRNASYYFALTFSTGAAALLFKLVYGKSQGPSPGRGRITASIVWQALTTFVPDRLIGGFRLEPFPRLLAVGIAVTLAALLVAIIAAYRRNAGPVTLIIVSIVTSYLLLYTSDLLQAGATWSARRSDYMLAALPMVLVGVGRLRAWVTVDRARWHRSGGLVAAALAAAVLIAPALAASSSDAAFTRFFPRSGTSYLAALRANEPVWSSPHTTLVDLALPPGLIASWDAPQHHYQRDLLSLLDPALTDRPLGPDPIFLNDRGIPSAATLLPMEASLPFKSVACTNVGASQRSLYLRFPRRVRASPLHVWLNVTAQVTTSIRVAGVLKRSRALAVGTTQIQPGTHIWIVRLDTGNLDGLNITALGGSGVPCVHSAVLERVALADADNTCRLITPDGASGTRVNCPPRFEPQEVSSRPSPR
jgi:hypothetical protein